MPRDVGDAMHPTTKILAYYEVTDVKLLRKILHRHWKLTTLRWSFTDQGWPQMRQADLSKQIW